MSIKYLQEVIIHGLSLMIFFLLEIIIDHHLQLVMNQSLH